MKTLLQFAKEHGFEYVEVSAEDHEDGIGAIIGDNYVKNTVWYTRQEMAQELGVEILRKTFYVPNVDDFINRCENAGVVAMQITNKHEFQGTWTLNVHYIKS